MRSTREAYGRALCGLGAAHPFYVLDADLAKATRTEEFQKAYPQRFFDIGIAEGDLMGTAAGMASCGCTVFASTFAMFAAGRAYEQVRNAIAYNRLNVKIGATHGGVLIGEDGASHQCIEDIALMRVLPNMRVLVPCDERSTRWAVETALMTEGPFYLRFNRHVVPGVYTDHSITELQLGKGALLAEGGDVTLLAVGDMVTECLQAANLLKMQGISAAVADLCSVKPLDSELICRLAAKTGLVITVEDHTIIGGLAGAVSEVLAEAGMPARLVRIGLPDVFGRSGTRAELAEHFGLNAAQIAAVCMEQNRRR